ncbi:MAG: stress response translation initiation inhibitor YciH [Candidatus Diapherotrites archaeon]|nr:stress response translation initiation inhibitor YciH [Candidatus Diapherotrites archaeon]
MDEICQTCGLQKSLCVCGAIEKEQQKIKIRMITRKFGKHVTHVSGFETDAQAKELEKILKRKLACGGTSKDKIIELQGNHVRKVKETLLAEGYNGELIDDQR